MNQDHYPSARPLLSVRRLCVRLRQRSLLLKAARGDVRVIENLDLDLQPGEALGVIGESGCGKSTLARVICGLQEATSGSIRFADQELARAENSVWAAQRRHIQLIGPDSLQDLRPRAVLGRVLAATLKTLCPELGNTACDQHVPVLLSRVGLLPEDAVRMLKSLSPAELRRLAIARALAARPQLLIYDEPAVMLAEDSERQQIVDLLARLHREDGLAMLVMTQQPALVRHLCDRVMALYLGRVMEQGECDSVFQAPAHPYTRAVLATPPTLETSKRGEHRTRLLLEGERPNPAQAPIGCVFHPRCPMAEAACVREVPHLHRTGTTSRHYAACLFAPQPQKYTAAAPTQSTATGSAPAL